MWYLERIMVFIWAVPFLWSFGSVFDQLDKIFPNPIFKIVTLIICGLLGFYWGNHTCDYVED